MCIFVDTMATGLSIWQLHIVLCYYYQQRNVVNQIERKNILKLLKHFYYPTASVFYKTCFSFSELNKDVIRSLPYTCTPKTHFLLVQKDYLYFCLKISVKVWEAYLPTCLRCSNHFFRKRTAHMPMFSYPMWGLGIFSNIKNFTLPF